MVRHLAAPVLAVSLAAGCAPRSAPYHFRAPLLGGVSAPELATRSGVSRPSHADARAADSGRRSLSLAAARRSGGAPIPRRDTPAPAEEETSLAGSLRALVGARVSSGPVAFVLDVLEELGAPIDADLRSVERGTDLVELARDRGAFAPEGAPLPGDILVFDAVLRDEPASLLGVVASVDAAGTIEFVYLGRGVVRRGFANPGQPARKRDEAGRALNTFLRGNDGSDPRGTRSLAGELFAGFLRLDRLLHSRAATQQARVVE